MRIRKPIYTSGSTGSPKGIQHCSGGYLLGAKLTTKWVFDLQDSDVFWCTADVGWVTGHSYVAYGPLAAGATIVMYEGAPTVPDGGRFWKICETHRVTVFYTAPTAIRALMKLGEEIPARYDLSRLRLLGTVGEPINPEAWMWYHRVIGGERCPIVDTWWQTETGVIMISPVPGVTSTKPGSCTRPLPGIVADIVDEAGKPVTTPEAGGYLVIRKPWPSLLRTIWRDNKRYLSTYWEKFSNRTPAAVHNVAHQYGKTATFMPKPLVGDNGSGMHVHQSISREGKPLFAGDKYAGLSDRPSGLMSIPVRTAAGSCASLPAWKTRPSSVGSSITWRPAAHRSCRSCHRWSPDRLPVRPGARPSPANPLMPSPAGTLLRAPSAADDPSVGLSGLTVKFGAAAGCSSGERSEFRAHGARPDWHKARCTNRDR